MEIKRIFVVYTLLLRNEPSPEHRVRALWRVGRSFEFEVSAKGRQKSDTKTQNPIAHTSRVCTVNKIETNCSRKMSCGKSATFSILFRVVVVVSIALDVIVTIGLSRPRHCITHLLYSIFYVHIDWICTFSFFHRSGSGLLLFTCLVST